MFAGAAWCGVHWYILEFANVMYDSGCWCMLKLGVCLCVRKGVHVVMCTIWHLHLVYHCGCWCMPQKQTGVDKWIRSCFCSLLSQSGDVCSCVHHFHYHFFCRLLCILEATDQTQGTRTDLRFVENYVVALLCEQIKICHLMIVLF